MAEKGGGGGGGGHEVVKGKLLQLKTEVRKKGRTFTIQPVMVVAQLLVTFVCSVYIVNEFNLVLLVL